MFKIPFRSKLNFTKSSTSKKTNVATTIQPAAASTTNHQAREKDVATQQKNEIMKRQIHEKLHARNSSSLPELSRSPKMYRERSVDVDYQIQEVAEEFQETRISTVELRDDVDEQVAFAKVEMSQEISPHQETRVLPVEFRETEKANFVIEEAKVSIVQFRDDYDSSDEDVPMTVGSKLSAVEFRDNSKSEVIFAKVENFKVQLDESDDDEDFPLDDNKIIEKVATRQTKFEEVNEFEKIEYYEPYVDAHEENEYGEIVQASPRTVERRYFESVKNLQELQIELPPPTPIKRKSREESFNAPTTAEVESLQTEPPPIKPRTKKLAHRASDVSNSSREKVPPLEATVYEATVEKVVLSNGEIPNRKMEEISENFHDVVVLEDSVEDTNEATLQKQEVVGIETVNRNERVKPRDEPTALEIVMVESHHQPQKINVQVLPKSILKSSETHTSPKTITFNNETETISDSGSDCSDTESDNDDDVWTKVEDHRYLLNRYKSDYPDVPPPLPKTPPPPLDGDEEKEFSFA